MFEIMRTHRVRVEFNAAEIDDPGETCGIIDDQLFGSAAGREGKGYRSEPVRVVGRRALLIEGGLFRAVDEPFQNDGAIADTGERTRGDGEVVADQVEFGDLGFAGKIQLVGIGYTNLVTVDCEDLRRSGFVAGARPISNRLHQYRANT